MKTRQPPVVGEVPSARRAKTPPGAARRRWSRQLALLVAAVAIASGLATGGCGASQPTDLQHRLDQTTDDLATAQQRIAQLEAQIAVLRASANPKPGAPSPTVGPTHAPDEVYTPPFGSVERKQILDGVRTGIENRRAEFVVYKLRVRDRWAYAELEQVLSATSRSETFAALLHRKTDGTWLLLEALGGSDAVQVVEAGDFADVAAYFRARYPAAPAAIFE